MWLFKRPNKFVAAARLARAKDAAGLERMLRCGAFPPGALVGYPCTLRRHHQRRGERHEALISTQTTNGSPSGRTVRTWG